jgi:hypothetical protein
LRSSPISQDPGDEERGLVRADALAVELTACKREGDAFLLRNIPCGHRLCFSVSKKIRYGRGQVRKIETGIWELRVGLDKRFARVVFTVVDDTALLIHGFIKKTRKIPVSDLALLRRRARSLGR